MILNLPRLFAVSPLPSTLAMISFFQKTNEQNKTKQNRNSKSLLRSAMDLQSRKGSLHLTGSIRADLKRPSVSTHHRFGYLVFQHFGGPLFISVHNHPSYNGLLFLFDILFRTWEQQPQFIYSKAVLVSRMICRKEKNPIKN